MVGNWYEDRCVRTDTKTAPTTFDRVFIRDLDVDAPGPSELATTNRAAAASMQASHPTAAVNQPSLFTGRVEERLGAYGQPVALAYTMGRVDPEVKAAVPTADFTTTSRAAFTGAPVRPSDEQPRFGQTGQLAKDTWDGKSDAGKFGAKGSRGEISRNPREGGNPYGVSVFVDEYATWGAKLQGMPLSESVGKATTKYF
ncbi:hypothetical protein FOA52_003471 [Chlamydomonas sp. UWO 241]|nr:hypothetical protein FOA52_003471 [Chlamydomonas sp. UWO 241]